LVVAIGKNKKNVPYFGLIDIKKGKEIVIEEGEKQLIKSKPFVSSFAEFCEDTIYG